MKLLIGKADQYQHDKRVNCKYEERFNILNTPCMHKNLNISVTQ